MSSGYGVVGMLGQTTTPLSRLNPARWLVLRAGERGASQPQHVARSRSSADGKCHRSEPLPLMPVRTKSDPGLNMPAMRNRYRLDLLMRNTAQASEVVAQLPCDTLRNTLRNTLTH